MSTTMEEQGRLRKTLKDLEAYELPSKFTESGIAVSDDLVARYERARNSYLQKRSQQVLYDHISSYDGHDFELPPVPTDQEKQALRERRLKAQKELRETRRYK
jgi:hypothetical protein